MSLSRSFGGFQIFHLPQALPHFLYLCVLWWGPNDPHAPCLPQLPVHVCALVGSKCSTYSCLLPLPVPVCALVGSKCSTCPLPAPATCTCVCFGGVQMFHMPPASSHYLYLCVLWWGPNVPHAPCLPPLPVPVCALVGSKCSTCRQPPIHTLGALIL